jgi:plasmid replication initiation protein
MPLKSIYSFKLYEILKSEYDRQDYAAKKRELWNPNATYITEMHIVDLKLRVGIIDSSWSNEIAEELRKPDPDYNLIEKITDALLKSEGAIDKNKKTYKSYKRIDNFKKNVLDRAKEELEEKTSIKFDYENLTGGAGGKVYGIRFFISKNIKESDTIEIVENPKVFMSKEEKFEILETIADMIGNSFSYRDVKVISERAGYNIEKVKNAYEIMLSNKTTISDPTAWMISAIEKNYQRGIGTKLVKTYANPNEDISELEALLLDN